MLKSFHIYRFLFIFSIFLIFQNKNFSQISFQKKGGVCFRVDDTQQKQRWLDYSAVFDKYGYKFCMGQCLDGNLWDTAYINLIRNLSANGHEFMDHTPSHTTNYIKVLNYSDTTIYSGNPFVHHINDKKICLKYSDSISSLSASGLINLSNGNMIISQNSGGFGNMYGNPYYYAIYIPLYNGVYTYYDLQNKNSSDPDTMKLLSFWNESVNLTDNQNLIYYKISQYAVKMPFGSRKIIADRTKSLCIQNNLPIPKTWIHPGGSFPMLSKSEVKEVWADLNDYTSAASYLEGSLKCYNEYDSDKQKRYGVMWGDFIEENWTMPAIKAKIADGIAKHYVVFGQSHFTNLTGGWSGYLERMDTLLNWLQIKNIPVLTYQQWAANLFDSIPNPFVNVFPQPHIDLDANGIPDGYMSSAGLDHTDGVLLSGYKSYSKSSTGTLFDIQNLAGLEKGSNLFSIYTKGAIGDSVQIKITFPETSISIYKKLAADQVNWSKYSFVFTVPEYVNKVNVTLSVSNYISGNVKVSGFELRKISEIKIKKPNIQKKKANENFDTIQFNQLISDSLYLFQNINIQIYPQNSALIYNLNSANTLSISKAFSFWTGKDSLKVVVSNPDNSKDSCYLVFESVNPEICLNDSIQFQLSESFSNISWSSMPFDSSLKIGNYSSQKVRPNLTTLYTARCIQSNGDTVFRYLNVVVHNLPIAQAGSNITKCYGDTVILSASGGIVFQWNNNVFQNIPFTASNSLVYKVEVTDIYGCKASDSLALNVLPGISSGIIDSIQPICFQTSASLHTSMSVGNIIWQYSENQQWIDISNSNSPNYQTAVLFSNKTYRTKVSSSFCSDKYSEPYTVIVNPQPVSGVLDSDSTVCIGLAAQLLLNGHNSDIEWQMSVNNSNNWQAIGNSNKNNALFTTLPLNSKSFFRAKVGSNNCPFVYSNIDSVVITPYPLSGNLSVITPVCQNDSSKLIINGNTGTINWQIKSTGSTLWSDLSNSQQQQIYTSGLQTTSIVRVKVSNSVCPAIYTNIDTIKVDNYSSAGTISGNNLVCQFSQPKLKLNNYLGNTIWQSKTNYQNWNSYNALFVNDSLQCLPVDENISFRTIVKNGVCPSDTSMTFLINIDSLSKGGIAIANSPICTGDSTQIELFNFNGNILWQMSYNWGSTWNNVSSSYSGINSNILKTPVMTSGNLYRASVKNGVCPAAYSIPDTITVHQMTQGGTTNVISPICSGLTTKCYLYYYNGQIQWQESLDTINWQDVTAGLNPNSSPYTTAVLNATQYYRAKVKSGVCPEKYSTWDTVVVNQVVVPSVQISMYSGNNPQCAPGDTVKFRAFYSNGGNNPVLQWKKGWTNVGNDSVFAYLPQNNDQIKCQLTSNALCASPNNPTSNIITMTVNSLPTVNFTVPSLYDTLCSSVSYYQLTGGSPNGGVYSGSGVNNGIFNPSAIGIGNYFISYTITNNTSGCNNTAVDTISVVNCTSVDEIEKSVVNIFPNPSRNLVYFEIGNNCYPLNIEILNLSGDILIQKYFMPSEKYFIEHNLPSGLYFVKLKIQDNYFLKKLSVIK